MKNFLFLLIGTLGFITCQSDYTNPRIAEAEKIVEKDSSDANIQNLVKTIITEYEAANKKEEKIHLLHKGISVSKRFNLKKELNSFQLGLITEDPAGAETGQILFDLASSLKSRGNVQVSDIMFKNIAQNFPGLKNEATSQIADNGIEMDSLILQLGKKVFEPGTAEVNREVGLKFIDLCEAYALTDPHSEKALEYLFKGAEMARSMRSDRKALSMYDMILTRFPDSRRAATALFVKGFILENTYKDLDKARQCYEDFIAKYPNDELVDDVKVMLQNLGKSDEEFYNSIKK